MLLEGQRLIKQQNEIGPCEMRKILSQLIDMGQVCFVFNLF